MPALSKARHFEVISTVLALAEEQRGVSLEQAAAAVDLPAARVKELIEPVLYLEFRDATGEIVEQTRAFLLTEDGHVTVTEDHWLRSLAAEPPGPAAALRLLVAGTIVRGLDPAPGPALEGALRRLEEHLATTIVLPVERPPLLDACRHAARERCTLRVRYTNDAGVTRDREIEPWHVFSNWGRWYVHGRDVTEEQDKWFRVDRMHSAEPGDATFEPPADPTIPEWFDLSAHERTVRLRLPGTVLDDLPAPHRIGELVDRGGGQVEVEITVQGDHRLRHLLVAAGPDAEVLEPAEYADLRRTHAADLLAGYTDTERQDGHHADGTRAPGDGARTSRPDAPAEDPR